MSEFLLELYSEEIPPQLQIDARKNLEISLEKSFKEELLKYSSIKILSSPTRLTILIKDIPEEINIPPKEIRGPKVGVPENILNSFIKAQNVSKKEITKKENEKGKFYFIKTKPKKIFVKDLLIKIILNSIASLNWRKSMRWSDNNLMWGRPLRSILAIFNKKLLSFNFGHLKSKNTVIVEQDLTTKHKKINNFKEYQSFLNKNNIFLDQEVREKKILKKFQSICKKKTYAEDFNAHLIKEVVNIVEDPNVLLVSFNKDYLNIPDEIIISTLQRHQRYFPLFDLKKKIN